MDAPHLSYGGATSMGEKIVATTCGENKEERTCGYLLLVINQIVAITVATAMHLWCGGLRRGTKHPKETTRIYDVRVPARMSGDRNDV